MVTNKVFNNTQSNPIAPITEMLVLLSTPSYNKQTPQYVQKVEQFSQNLKAMLLNDTPLKLTSGH
ncbi:hypothetical protein CTM87_18640 [Photobacterium phosphoreum]|jgi:hypothetical protein|nr:hypothetical protein AYY24_13695 [Photobacterium phosphoreum]PSW33824.1 hypothetical protein CTM87_18640 [Photobacterium phosphoreum]